MKRVGGIDVLINNAGAFKHKPFLELEELTRDWFWTRFSKGNLQYEIRNRFDGYGNVGCTRRCRHHNQSG